MILECVGHGLWKDYHMWFLKIATWQKGSGFIISSVTQSCPTLCDLMDCSTPGFAVHHQLLELAQIHVHWVSDAIQPSPPLLSPCPPAFNLSQYQGLFQWVSSSHKGTKYWRFSFNMRAPHQLTEIYINS